MIKQQSLKKNFSWSFIGNLIFSLSQWILLIILTKLTSVKEVGDFTYAIAFTTPIVLFLQFQLRSVQVTDVKKEYSFSHYFNLRLISALITFVFILISCIVLRFEMNLTMIILCVTLMKLMDSISDVNYGLFQKNECMKYVAASRGIQSIISLGSYVITLLLLKNVPLAILSVVIIKLLVTIFYDLKRVSYFDSLHFLYDYRAFKKLLIVAFPLGIMSTLMSLDSNIPRYVLKEFEGTEGIAYFSALAYINMIGGQMITAIAQTAAPRLAVYYQNDYKKFKNLLLNLSLIGTALGIISILFVVLLGKPFLTLLYSKAYAEQSGLFILIIIAGAINYSSSFLGTALTSARAFKIQPYLGILWVLCSFIFSFMFIPDYGIYGAGIAMILSSIIKLITKLVAVYKLPKKYIGNHVEKARRLDVKKIQ